MLNLCGIVAAILNMATSRNCSMSGHHYLPAYQIWMISDNVEFCDIVAAILKMATARNFSMSGINLGHHYLPTYQILMISDNVEFLPPIFIPYFGSYFENSRHLEILKTQNCSSNGDLSLCQIYFSIIIHLEVININVRNFNFPSILISPILDSFDIARCHEFL